MSYCANRRGARTTGSWRRRSWRRWRRPSVRGRPTSAAGPCGPWPASPRATAGGRPGGKETLLMQCRPQCMPHQLLTLIKGGGHWLREQPGTMKPRAAAVAAGGLRQQRGPLLGWGRTTHTPACCCWTRPSATTRAGASRPCADFVNQCGSILQQLEALTYLLMLKPFLPSLLSPSPGKPTTATVGSSSCNMLRRSLRRACPSPSAWWKPRAPAGSAWAGSRRRRSGGSGRACWPKCASCGGVSGGRRRRRPSLYGGGRRRPSSRRRRGAPAPPRRMQRVGASSRKRKEVEVRREKSREG
mmetsp:Transcript_50436/g.73747  ORF Transcript_50436/g.73747 Transcript_50436/m.73747 type:complete len:300 (+) Transcript_50436:424-1323(+)